MLTPIPGIKANSIIHRFIASGKPGLCSFCKKSVEKLEAHHIKYEPEITINLCHDCHHKIHFWPNRLTQHEKFTALKKVFPEQKALELSQFKNSSISDLAKIIAPSRNLFIHEAQKIEQATLKSPQHPSLPNRKIPEHVLSTLKNIKRLSPSPKHI